MAQMVKNPPAVRETWVRSLGWEDPLEKSMATHSSILAWRIAMHREAWWATYSPWGCKELDTTEWLTQSCNAGAMEDVGSIPGSGRSPGGGNGDPLQYPCLGNPMGRGARLQSLGSQRVGHD